MKRTIKVHEASGHVTIPLRGARAPHAFIAIQDIRGASYWGPGVVNVALVGGSTLDADLDEAGFAALLRVLVSEYEQRALKADDVASIPFG